MSKNCQLPKHSVVQNRILLSSVGAKHKQHTSHKRENQPFPLYSCIIHSTTSALKFPDICPKHDSYTHFSIRHSLSSLPRTTPRHHHCRASLPSFPVVVTQMLLNSSLTREKGVLFLLFVGHTSLKVRRASPQQKRSESFARTKKKRKSLFA